MNSPHMHTDVSGIPNQHVNIAVESAQAQAHAQAHAYQRSLANLYTAPTSTPLPLVEQRPPGLTRRGPTCACSLGMLALMACLLFCGVLLLEAPFVALENQMVDNRMRAAPFRKDHASTMGALPVSLGLWDEEKRITSLQLVVCLSLALGINEDHVLVTSEGSHFYTSIIHKEGSWIVSAVNDEGSLFLETLNAQAQRFGAKLVISHEAVSITNTSR